MGAWPLSRLSKFRRRKSPDYLTRAEIARLEANVPPKLEYRERALEPLKGRK